MRCCKLCFVYVACDSALVFSTRFCAHLGALASADMPSRTRVHNCVLVCLHVYLRTNGSACVHTALIISSVLRKVPCSSSLLCLFELEVASFCSFCRSSNRYTMLAQLLSSRLGRIFSLQEHIQIKLLHAKRLHSSAKAGYSLCTAMHAYVTKTISPGVFERICACSCGSLVRSLCVSSRLLRTLLLAFSLT